MTKLIVLSGVPGTGKSAIAEALARDLSCPVFAKDWVEATLLSCQLTSAKGDSHGLGFASYELLTVLASRQLALAQSVILDSVAAFERIREGWKKLAEEHGADWLPIECICSDEQVHRERLANRVRGIPGWAELDWSEVKRVRGHYQPWSTDRLILDSMNDLSSNIEAARTYTTGNEQIVSK